MAAAAARRRRRGRVQTRRRRRAGVEGEAGAGVWVGVVQVLLLMSVYDVPLTIPTMRAWKVPHARTHARTMPDPLPLCLSPLPPCGRVSRSASRRLGPSRRRAGGDGRVGCVWQVLLGHLMWVYMGVSILGRQHRPFFPPDGTWLRWRTDSNWGPPPPPPAPHAAGRATSVPW